MVPSLRMIYDRSKHLDTVFLSTLGYLTILQNFEYHESFSQLSIHLIVVANLHHNCVTYFSIENRASKAGRKLLRTNNTLKNAEYEQHIIIDIIISTTSGDSSQGRQRGGEATEWNPREPQAPEGKGIAKLNFSTDARLKCWGR